LSEIHRQEPLNPALHSMTARYRHLAPNTLHAAVESITATQHEIKSGTSSGTSPKEQSQEAQTTSEEVLVCL
jgi:hypothetical protein